MPNFTDAYNKLLRAEGGYCWDIEDNGGETFCGVARNFWPNWKGWPAVDAAKAALGVGAGERPERGFWKQLTATLKAQPDTMQYVVDYYKTEYWNKFNGDGLPYPLAYFLFQFGVNVGIGGAIKYLQECLNYMNKQGTLYPDLAEDGGFGPKTLAAMNAAMNLKYDMSGAKVLLCMLRGTQVRHYQAIMKRNPSQETFCAGWIIRAFDHIDGEETL